MAGTTAYEPGVQGDPFGNPEANPEGSFYAGISSISPNESSLLFKAIKDTIFDAAPKQYNALKLLYQKEPVDRNLDEHEYKEKTFGRASLEVDTGSGGTSASGTSIVSDTFTATADSISNITEDLIVIFPDNTKGTITNIDTGTNEVTVSSLAGGSIPSTTSGEEIAIQSTIYGDGQDYFANYERLDLVTRHNFIQFYLRARRWGEREIQKHINAATTDYLDHERMEKLDQLRVDLFNSFFNGDRGEFQLRNGGVAKSMGGVYPLMVDAGAQSSNPTLAGLEAAFESLVFSTNYKQEGETRFLYGTDEMLTELSKIYKGDKVRYAPNDQIANLNLSMIQVGTANLVLVPCQLFGETSCFPSEWQSRILCLDQESIQPTKMAGIPHMDMGGTLDLQDLGSREGFKDWWCRAQLGMEFHNPLGGFWIDVQ